MCYQHERCICCEDRYYAEQERAEFFEDIVKQLYSSDQIDIVKLKNSLEFLADSYDVKLPSKELRIK